MNFDDYINHNYRYNHKQLDYDTSDLFKTLKVNNQLLTNEEINKYIKKITHGKTKSLLTNYNGYFYINELVDRHNLSETQVTTILTALLDGHTYTYYKTTTKKDELAWIDKLLHHGYIFTDQQINKLIELQYNGIINFINKKTNKTISDLHIVCKLHNVTLNTIADMCNENNLIPDNKCFEHVLCIPGSLSKSYAKVYRYTICDIIKTFMAHKFIPDSETITILISNSLKRKINYSDIKQITDKGAKITIDHINSLLCSHGLSFDNLYNLLEDAHINHKLILDVSHFKNIILYSEIPSDVENVEIVDPREILYKFFIETIKIEITSDLCEYICEKSDSKLLKYLINNNLFKATDKALSIACEKFNTYAIKELINMKAIATKETILNSRSNINKKIVDLLIMSGLPVDYETVDILYSKGFLFDDLTVYGLEYNDEIYYIIHKHSTEDTEFPKKKKAKKGSTFENAYLEKLNLKLVNFRLMFYTNTIDKIKEQMKIDNLEPDQFCFDNSMESNYEVFEWLMNTYNFKPTILSFLRLTDESRLYRYSTYNKDIIMTDLKNIYVKKTNIVPAIIPIEVPDAAVIPKIIKKQVINKKIKIKPVISKTKKIDN